MDDLPFSYQQLPSRTGNLRVAIVTETYPPEINGVAMTISRMVEGLQARQHQIQLIRPRQNRDDVPSSAPGIEEQLCPGITIPRYESLKMGLPAKRALTRLWTYRRPDIVHVVTEGPLGWSAVAVAHKLRIPCSSDFHTNFHSYSEHYGVGWLKAPIVAYLRKLHNRADCTMVPTKALSNELARMGYRNLRVVSRGVDTALFNPSRRSDDLRRSWHAGPGEQVAIYVGRLAAEKNLETVLSAYAQIKQGRNKARLVLVGDGPERGAIESSHPDIVFAGMRSGEDLARHYASGDVFLFASTTETFGNVTVEAMASGLAVVAYNYAAAAEHIQHERSGWLAEFNDAEEFRRLALAAMLNAELSASVGRAARLTAETIDWHSVNGAFESALVDVVSAHKSDGIDRLYCNA